MLQACASQGFHGHGRSLCQTTDTYAVNIWPQSSQLAGPLWTDPGMKSGISAQELNSTWKKKRKSVGGEWMVEHFPQIIASEEKATRPQPANHGSWACYVSEPGAGLPWFPLSDDQCQRLAFWPTTTITPCQHKPQFTRCLRWGSACSVRWWSVYLAR